MKEITNAYRTIPLNRGLIAIVDAHDYETLSAFKWYATWSPSVRSFYAVRKTRFADGRRGHIRMHRVILGLERFDKRQGDHINHNTLDNRRSNLRIATCSENQRNTGANRRNTSGYKGVSFNKAAGRWRAAIRVHGERIHLGHYQSPEAAHAAYCTAAERLHGEFARIA